MMSSFENVTISEQELTLDKKSKELKKRFNSESWNDDTELLMKQWGEKSGGLRYMHAYSSRMWRNFSNRLSITGIFVTSIASGLSLIATGVDDEKTKNAILFGVGGIGFVSTFIQSLKKFYNSEEKAADGALKTEPKSLKILATEETNSASKSDCLISPSLSVKSNKLK